MSIKKKCIAMALAASIAGMGVVSCSGSYALFNKAHPFFGNLGGKWIGAVVNWVAWGVGIYGICLFADLLIFNTIEFWSGSNPVAMGDTYEEMSEDGSKVYAVVNADGTLSMTVTDAQGNVADVVLERVDNEVRMYNTEGELLSYYKANE